MRPDRPLPTLRKILARGHLQLVLFAVLLAAASLTLSGMVVIRGYSQANLALAARTISYTVEPAVLFGDRDAAREASVSVAGLGNVRRLVIRDAKGAVMVEWERQTSGMAARFEGAANAVFSPGAHVEPIVHANDRIGTVELYGSADALLGYGFSGLIIALCCLGLTVIATRILARRLEEGVVAPLEQLATVADAVRSDRDLTRRADTSEIAEIDAFGKDFNALLGELQDWRQTMLAEREGLTHAVEHDPLTGLGNRVRFQHQLRVLVEQSADEGTSFAVLYVDADRFKAVNDHYGHAAGDRVLIEIAKRLRQSVREVDHAFRLGGDEFTILLEPHQDAASVEQVVARIARAFADPVEWGGSEPLAVGVSVGAAICPVDGRSADELTACADARMYKDKKGKTSR